MLKSIVKIAENEIKSKPYPKLMINEDTGLIVLMTEGYYSEYNLSSGFVINPGTSSYKIGYTSNEFILCRFKDFHGSVTLEQD